jgi:hypothetical protein
MQTVNASGVVPIGGAQTNIVITAATAIVLPTSAQRAPLDVATGFKPGTLGQLIMWLAIELQDARLELGSAPTVANGLLFKQTSAPIVFTDEREMKLMQWISIVAGGTITYRFFRTVAS